MTSNDIRQAASEGIQQLHARILQQVHDDCRPDLLLPMLEAQLHLVQKVVAVNDISSKAQSQTLSKSEANASSAESLADTVALLREQLKSVTIQRDELQQRLLASNSRKPEESCGGGGQNLVAVSGAAEEELAKLKEKYARLVKQCKIFKETIRQLREDSQQSVETPQKSSEELTKQSAQQDAQKQQLIEQLQREFENQRLQFEQQDAQKQQLIEQLIQQVDEHKHKLEIQKDNKFEMEKLQHQLEKQSEQLELLEEKKLQVEQLQHQLEDQKQQLDLHEQQSLLINQFKDQIEDMRRQLELQEEDKLQIEQLQQQLKDQGQQFELQDEQQKLQIEQLKQEIEEQRLRIEREEQNHLQQDQIQQQLALNEMQRTEIEKLQLQLEEERQFASQLKKQQEQELELKQQELEEEFQKKLQQIETEKQQQLKQIDHQKQEQQTQLIEAEELEEQMLLMKNEKHQIETYRQQIEAEKQELEMRIQHIEAEKQQLEKRIQLIETEKQQELEKQMQQLKTEKQQELAKQMQQLEAEKQQELGKQMRQLEVEKQQELEKQMRQLEVEKQQELEKQIQLIETEKQQELAKQMQQELGKQMRQLEVEKQQELEKQMQQLEAEKQQELGKQMQQFEQKILQIQTQQQQSPTKDTGSISGQGAVESQTAEINALKLKCAKLIKLNKTMREQLKLADSRNSSMSSSVDDASSQTECDDFTNQVRQLSSNNADEQRKELERQLSTSNAESEKLHFIIDSLTKQLSEVERQLNESKSEYDRILGTATNSEQRLKECEQKLTSSRKEADELRQSAADSAEKLAIKIAELDQLQQAFVVTEERLLDSEKQAESIRAERYRQTASELEDKLAGTERKLKIVADEAEQLRGRLAEAEEQVDVSRAESERFRLVAADATENLSATERQLTATNSEFDQIRLALTDAEQKLALMTEQLAATTYENEQLRLKLLNSDFEKHLEETVKELKASQEKSNQLQQALNETTVKVTDLEGKQLLASRAEVDDLHQQISVADNDADYKLPEVEKQLEDSRSESEQLRQSLAEANEKLNETRNQLLASEDNAKQHEKRVSDLEERLTESERCLTACRQEVDHFKSASTDAAKRLAFVEGELSARNTDIEQLRHEASDAKEQLSLLEEKLSVKTTEAENLKLAAADAEKRLSTSSTDFAEQIKHPVLTNHSEKLVEKERQVFNDRADKQQLNHVGCINDSDSDEISQLKQALIEAKSELIAEAANADQLRIRLTSMESVLNQLKDQNATLLGDLDLGKKAFEKLLLENGQLRERLAATGSSDSSAPPSEVAEAVIDSTVSVNVEGTESSALQVKLLSTQLSRAKGQLLQLRSERNKIYHEYMRVRRDKEECERQLAAATPVTSSEEKQTKPTKPMVNSGSLHCTENDGCPAPAQVVDIEIQRAAAVAGQREEELLAIRSENEGLRFRQSLLETKVKKMEIRMRAQREKLERYQLRFDEKDRELEQLVDKVRHHRALFDNEKSARLREVNQLKSALAAEEARARRMEKQRGGGGGGGRDETQALLEELSAARQAKQEVEQRCDSEIATLRAQLDELAADSQELRAQLVEAKRRLAAAGSSSEAELPPAPAECSECKRLREALRVLEAQKQRHRSASQSEQQHEQLLRSAAAALDAALRMRGMAGLVESATTLDAVLRSCATRIEESAAALNLNASRAPADSISIETQTEQLFPPIDNKEASDLTSVPPSTASVCTETTPVLDGTSDSVAVDLPVPPLLPGSTSSVADWLRHTRPLLRSWPAPLRRARIGPRGLAIAYLSVVHLLLVYCLLA